MAGPGLLRWMLPGLCMGWLLTRWARSLMFTGGFPLLWALPGLTILGAVLVWKSHGRSCVWGVVLGGVGLGACSVVLEGSCGQDLAPMEEGMLLRRFQVAEAWPSFGGQFRSLARDAGGSWVLLTDDAPLPAGWQFAAVCRWVAPTPPVHVADFDERRFLTGRGVRAKYDIVWRGQPERTMDPMGKVRRVTARIRQRIRHKWLGADSGPGTGLLLALTTGDRSEMPRPVRLAFAGAGLAHLTAVSGFHTGLVSAFVLVLLGAVGWPRRWRPVVLVPVVWAYVGVCGFPASALRAAAMATLAALALSAQRQPDGLTFLSAAGMLLWVLSPHAVLDLGTGLSFLATAGILCLHASPVIRRTSRWRGVVLMAGVPLVAVAFTAPLAWPAFGQQPLVFLPANILVTPWVTVLVVLSAVWLALPAGWGSGLEQVLIQMAEALVWCVQWAEQIPPAVLPLSSVANTMAGCLLALGCALALLGQRARPWFLAGAFSALALLRMQDAHEERPHSLQIGEEVLCFNGASWTVFPPRPERHRPQWKTRTYLERVSTGPLDSVRWSGTGLAFSRHFIRYHTPDGAWQVVSSSRKRCGSRGPHKLPRPPCP